MKPIDATADARLRSEPIIWLTTVSAQGQPQSTPVWFLWDGSEFLIYGSKDGQKTRNIQANPRVSLHLDGNGAGGGIVTFECTARVDSTGPPASAVTEYVAKYGERIESYGWNLESVARDYPHVIRATPTRARIW
ncbi:MAG TPA: TIGR03667 family PPOX class F420-dependent oxidoreductase [Streptosporangiaceae bacterium]|nr:TIGR03667 family PPOX class F420-dependent oxidoreductase [Streptosporangiaceae bacterium]